MKSLKVMTLFWGIIVFGLGFFAVFRYSLNPKMVAFNLCRQSENCIKGLHISDSGATQLAFSKDGQFLFGRGGSGARIWNTRKNFQIKRLSSRTRSFALAADGHYALGKNVGQVELYDAQGKKLLEFSTSDKGLSTIQLMVFTPGYDMLAMPMPGDERGKPLLSFWSRRDGRFVTQLPHDSTITSLAASAKGTLAVGQTNGKVVLWPLEDFSQYQVIKISDSSIAELAFDADGELLLAADAQGQISLWHTPSTERLQTFKGPESLVTGLVFFAGASRMIASYTTGHLVLWNRSGEELLSWQYPRSIAALALSPDDKLLAIALHKKGYEVALLDERNIPTLDSYVRIDPAVILLRDLSQFAR